MSLIETRVKHGCMQQVNLQAWQDTIVSCAFEWIGTPYHHQAAVKHHGADCLGFLRGLYFELYGKMSETPPPYRRDWAELGGGEPMLRAAERYLDRVPTHQQARGDVLLFRFRPNMSAKHAAVFISDYKSWYTGQLDVTIFQTSAVFGRGSPAQASFLINS